MHATDDVRPPLMVPDRPPGRHLRPRDDGLEQRTTTVELFFDLVYVFAVTQLSHMGRLARDAYTYLHAPIVAGIIAVAV